MKAWLWSLVTVNHSLLREELLGLPPVPAYRERDAGVDDESASDDLVEALRNPGRFVLSVPAAMLRYLELELPTTSRGVRSVGAEHSGGYSFPGPGTCPTAPPVQFRRAMARIRLEVPCGVRTAAGIIRAAVRTTPAATSVSSDSAPSRPPLRLVRRGRREDAKEAPAVEGGEETMPRSEVDVPRALRSDGPGTTVKGGATTPHIARECPRSPCQRRSRSKRRGKGKSDCRLRRRLASVVKEYQNV